MKIEYFLIGCFIILSYWLIPKLSFIKNSHLSDFEIRLLLLAKGISGILCAYYFTNFSTTFDYVGYNMEGMAQYNLLLSNPLLFFTDFTHDIKTYGWGRLFETSNSFWADLRFNLLYKGIALFDLLTNGNFYFNTIIFCTIVFFGHIAFYRIYSQLYKGHKIPLLLATFFLPSLLLYTSCIHKDGIIFFCVGMISYVVSQFLASSGRTGFKHGLIFFACMTAVFLFRNYVIVAIVPAMLVAMLCKFFPGKKKTVFLCSYLLFFLAFFLSGFSSSSFNLPAAVVQRKSDFALLPTGTTTLKMNTLYPTVSSFLSNLPQAINHSFFRPYLWEFSQPSVFLTGAELFLYQIVLICFLFYRKRTTGSVHDFNIYGLAFLFIMALIIGYTIPNIGAIVRYRSIFWIFLLCPLVCNTDWKKMGLRRKANL